MEDSCPMDVKFVKLNFEKNHKGIVDELYYSQERIFSRSSDLTTPNVCP